MPPAKGKKAGRNKDKGRVKDADKEDNIPVKKSAASPMETLTEEEKLQDLRRHVQKTYKEALSIEGKPRDQPHALIVHHMTQSIWFIHLYISTRSGISQRCVHDNPMPSSC
jgi:hypothetical protein